MNDPHYTHKSNNNGNLGFRVAKLEAISESISRSIDLLYQSQQETNRNLDTLNTSFVHEIRRISEMQAGAGKWGLKELMAIGGFVIGVVSLAVVILTSLGQLAITPMNNEAEFTRILINDTRIDAGLSPYQR